MARRGARPPSEEAEGQRLWKRVTATVTPPKARKAARVTPGAAEPAIFPAVSMDDLVPEVKRKPGAATAKTTKPPRANTGPALSPASAAVLQPASPKPKKSAPSSAEELEPRRHRRLSRERDPIEARLDLHGFSRFEAEDQLRAFLVGAHARGLRAVLVITGQGRLGGGVIRASVHDWLASPSLRAVVSGHAWAHRRHGGDGALYITLRRRD